MTTMRSPSQTSMGPPLSPKQPVTAGTKEGKFCVQSIFERSGPTLLGGSDSSQGNTCKLYQIQLSESQRGLTFITPSFTLQELICSFAVLFSRVPPKPEIFALFSKYFAFRLSKNDVQTILYLSEFLFVFVLLPPKLQRRGLVF